MAHSYTPGLTVAEFMRVRKRRTLPILGEVKVESGQTVEASDIVAYTELPGDVYPVNAANILGISPGEVPGAMLKKTGEKAKMGEVIARSTSFFGLFKSTASAPIDGTIETVSNITGQVILRGKPLPVEVKAYVPGLILEVIPNEGVVVECTATFIQGIFGIGGEANGRLLVAVDGPGDILDENKVHEDHQGAILVGGSMVTAAALEKAEKLGVAGIVAGGFDDRDLRDYLGYDLGVAITGSEDIGITLVITEGFGSIRMAEKTFSMLEENEGRVVSINGATQIRAGVIRPEVVIPRKTTEARIELEESAPDGLETGALVRCIRHPYFGKIGRVTALPSELRRLESETKVRVMELCFEDGAKIILPRANVETIEGN